MKITLLALSLVFAVLVRAQEFSTPIRVNSDTVGTDSDPAMHVGRNGSIYVSWVKLKGHDMLGDIYFSRSDDKGKSFLPAIRATVGAEISPNLQRAAQFAIDIMGNIHMVWTELRVNDQHDIWYIRSTDDGMTWTTPVSISNDSAKYLQDFPSIACDSSGNTYVSFIDSRERGRGISNNEQLYMVKSTDNGLTWSSAKKANAMPGGIGGTCECCKQDIQAGKNGVVAIAFRSNMENRRDIFAVRSTDFGETFAQAVPIQAQQWMLDACPASGPNCYMTPGGDLHVAWRDARTIVGRPHIYYDVLPIGQTETFYKPINNVRIDVDESLPNWPDISVANGLVAISYETSTTSSSYMLMNTDLTPLTSAPLPDGGDKMFMAVEFAPDGTRYFAWQDQGYSTDDIAFVKDTMTLPLMSVRERQNEEAFVCPNPVTSGNVVTIVGNAISELSDQYSLVDMLGRTVYEGTLQPAGERYNALIPKLTAGQYILHVGAGRTFPLIVTN